MTEILQDVKKLAIENAQSTLSREVKYEDYVNGGIASKQHDGLLEIAEKMELLSLDALDPNLKQARTDGTTSTDALKNMQATEGVRVLRQFLEAYGQRDLLWAIDARVREELDRREEASPKESGPPIEKALIDVFKEPNEETIRWAIGSIASLYGGYILHSRSEVRPRHEASARSLKQHSPITKYLVADQLSGVCRQILKDLGQESLLARVDNDLSQISIRESIEHGYIDDLSSAGEWSPRFASDVAPVNREALRNVLVTLGKDFINGAIHFKDLQAQKVTATDRFPIDSELAMLSGKGSVMTGIMEIFGQYDMADITGMEGSRITSGFPPKYSL